MPNPGDPTATAFAEADSDTPVLLVHGWGGSFRATWQRSGFTALLADADRPVIGVDLLGHGEAPKPHDPAAYADLTVRIREVLPDRPVDAVGFSLGALTLLRLAADEPHRFRRLVLAGIGENVFVTDPDRHATILAALDGTGSPDDNIGRLFLQYASQPGNDIAALSAVLRRPGGGPFSADDLQRVTCPTLIVLGELDFAAPGDRLASSLPDARLVTLRKVDHFATPEAFGFIDAALEFLDAIPT